MGEVFFFQGKHSPSLMHFEKAINYYNTDVPRELLRRGFWVESGAASFVYEGLVLWHSGHIDQALKKSEEGVVLAEQLVHPFTCAFNYCYIAWLHRQRREPQACREWAEKAIALSTEYGFPNWLMLGKSFFGWAVAELGETKSGVLELQQGITGWRKTGATMGVPGFLTWLAEALKRDEDIEQGIACVTEALAIIEQTGMGVFEPEAHRFTSELLLQQSQDNAPQAEASFQKALDVSRSQKAKALELRAATSLARLWQQQGKKTEAYDLLTPLYKWFTEGFDTQDLKDAEALLEELS